MAKDLECPVCLTIPEGEVHQCNEGHCCCLSCWRRLNPRRCPECRQPIQNSCRNRDREARIAALQATCNYCSKATTHDTRAAHLLVCPQRPRGCVGAAGGCGWLGMAAEEAGHEAVCLIAVWQRVMAPLQAQNQQLQACCDGLYEQNQELQARVAAFEPPALGDLRAPEGEMVVGGQQPQHVGAVPHDAPSSEAIVAVMLRRVMLGARGL